MEEAKGFHNESTMVASTEGWMAMGGAGAGACS